ncbi:hypothetical protein [Mesorhizobium japonicum]|uniref:hypothetical protein n=1 Tax=Mesorhizobium japonicum TaxID=2066070 RepID=UPI0005C95099|nr:hypothetical protein [Mesorhizobium japonicum]
MDEGGDHLHCILHILRLGDGPNKRECVGDMIVSAVMLTKGQEIRRADQGVGGEPLQSWLRRQQRRRKPLENIWERVDDSVQSG